MSEVTNRFGRKRGRGLRPWLITVKIVGLIGFMGGLAALAALILLGPEGQTIPQWLMLKTVVRMVFYPCVFGGLFLTVIAGLALWLQLPLIFLRMRWFKLKLIWLLFFIPGSHLYARWQMLQWHDAIDAGRLEDISRHYQQVGYVFAVSLVVFFVPMVLGRIKPRLKQPIAPFKRPASGDQ